MLAKFRQALHSNYQTLISGCVLAPAFWLSCDAFAQEADQELLPPVSVFSSFASDAIEASCEQRESCINDFIDPSLFFDSIKDKQRFLTAAASQNGFDYEILIANVLLNATEGDMVTEIDIVWRGIPLASYQFTANGIASTMTQEQKVALAEKTIGAFFQQSGMQKVFSAKYLFEKLKASDYAEELKLPPTIDSFFLQDMQLYRDPFQGAVARYSHPEYEREVLDVFVYPIFDQSTIGQAPQNDEQAPKDLALESSSALLSKELSKDIDDIKLVAQSRDIGEISISDIKQLNWHTESAQFQGYYFDVQAEDSEGEPLFTTTYLFKSKDKFIKFSANFPDRIAQNMVKNALPQIEVPEPSELMQTLRGNNG